MNNNSSFKFSQDFEVIPFKKEKVYMIAKREWDFLKSKLRNIGYSINIYYALGVFILGLSGTAWLNIIFIGFPKNPDGSCTKMYVICIAFAIATAIIGALLLWFGERQRKAQKTKVADVLEQMNIIENRYSEDKDINQKEIVQPKPILEIITATYGTEQVNLDVTEELKQKIVNNKLEIVASNSIKGDPAKGTIKKLTIKYVFGGKTMTKEFVERTKAIIP